MSDCPPEVILHFEGERRKGVIQCGVAIYSWHTFNDFFKAADCVVNSSSDAVNAEAFLGLIACRVIKTGCLSRRRDEDVLQLKLWLRYFCSFVYDIFHLMEVAGHKMAVCMCVVQGTADRVSA